MLQEEEEGGESYHPMNKKKPTLQSMDWISDLPDPIVHYIMSFLPTLDITRVSILSRRFFFLWSSFPILDFDQDKVIRPLQGTVDSRADEFLDYIHNSVRLRRIDTVLSKFRVKANLHDILADYRLNFAISFALENRVKSMDLKVGSGKYLFPSSFASKSINVLRLKGFSLDPNVLILDCPSLESLSLTSCLIAKDIKCFSKTLRNLVFRSCEVKMIEVNAPNLESFFYNGSFKEPKPCEIDVLACQKIASLTFNDVVTGSSWVEEHVCKLGNLETFVLTGCNDIESIRVCNKKIERVEIGNCAKLGMVEILAPSLRSFEYRGADQNRSCNISFVASKLIEELWIEGAGITDQWIEAQLAALHYLVTLQLKACSLLRRVRIFHETLQALGLFNCIRLVEVEVDTPQLLSFCYDGEIVFFGTVVTRSRCTATLILRSPINYSSEWFYQLRNLLSFFGHCMTLKLICNCDKDLIVPEDLRDNLLPPLYDLKFLEVHVKSLKKIETDLVDSLLWLSPHPETLCITSASGSGSVQMNLKFVYDVTIEEEEDEMDIFCCRTKPIKCWRHNLKKVELESNNRSPTGEVELQNYFLRKAMRLESVTG